MAWVTLGLLFFHFGRSEQPTLFNLQKTLNFTMSFNDLTPLGVRTNGRFLGHSGLTLRPLLGNFVQLGANLSIWSLLRNHFDPFTKNIFCRQFQKKYATIQSIWGRFGGACG